MECEVILQAVRKTRIKHKQAILVTTGKKNDQSGATTAQPASGQERKLSIYSDYFVIAYVMWCFLISDGYILIIASSGLSCVS